MNVPKNEATSCGGRLRRIIVCANYNQAQLRTSADVMPLTWNAFLIARLAAMQARGNIYKPRGLNFQCFFPLYDYFW